jgi:hypothetical protein
MTRYETDGASLIECALLYHRRETVSETVARIYVDAFRNAMRSAQDRLEGKRRETKARA